MATIYLQKENGRQELFGEYPSPANACTVALKLKDHTDKQVIVRNSHHEIIRIY